MREVPQRLASPSEETPKKKKKKKKNQRSCLIVAVTLHFGMVVSASKVADLQRVGMLASLEEFSIFHKRNKATQWFYILAKLKKRKEKENRL